jgi:hypothetical protein
MRRSTSSRNYFSLHSLRLAGIAVVFIASVFPVMAAKTDNIVARKTISKANREELARRLRSITGWTDLAFDSDGALKIGNAAARDGSKSARDLLSRTISGKHVILFEDASSRKDVVFCRVMLGSAYSTASPVYIVLIDFADFRQVTGDKRALAAFDVGWAVLHEIDHVVADSEDPPQDGVGDCESHINRMRRELGLPIRSSYFFSFVPLKNLGTLITRFVRLSFEQYDGASSKRRYWLIWDAAVVGGLPSDFESTRASLDASR